MLDHVNIQHTANEGPVWVSSTNVWFPFMYSQKWNCAPSTFPKQNYNVLPPNSCTHLSVRDLYISRISLSILLQPLSLLVWRGSVGSASACCKAGPSSILGSAPQVGVSHWAYKWWGIGERPQRMAMHKCIVWMWLNECMYVNIWTDPGNM